MSKLIKRCSTRQKFYAFKTLLRDFAIEKQLSSQPHECLQILSCIESDQVCDRSSFKFGIDALI